HFIAMIGESLVFAESVDSVVNYSSVFFEINNKLFLAATMTYTSAVAGESPVLLDWAVTADVTPSAPAVVTIDVSPTDSICPETPVIFTASAQNAGANPEFQWMLNNQPVGNNSATYETDSILNADEVFCILNSSSACASPPVDTSNVISMFVICHFDSLIIPPDFYGEGPVTSFSFQKNMGQIVDVDGNIRNDIKFYTHSQSPSVYFTDTTLSYVFAKVDGDSVTPDTLCRVDMAFPGSLPTMVCPKDVNSDYTNFYLGHCPQGITHVPNYQKVVMPDLWQHVDLFMTGNHKGLKYSFVAKPCSKPETIMMEYAGATAVATDSAGRLIVSSAVGNMTLEKPHAFVLDTTNQFIEDTLNVDFIITGNVVSFDIPAYPAYQTLVVQVDRGFKETMTNAFPVWSTYLGGSLHDFAYDLKTNDSGELYVAGSTWSKNFPTTPDVFQQDPGIGTQAFITKFSAEYSLLWATYCGGDRHDEAFGVTVDNTHDVVYICGQTSSTNTTLQSFALAGSTNCYFDSHTYTLGQGLIARFDKFGSREWLTRFGGPQSSCMKICCDATGSIYIVGNYMIDAPPVTGCSVPSTGGFPICDPGNGAFSQSFFAGGDFLPSDAYIAKFNKEAELVWSTLFGGGEDEYATNITVANDIVYIVGQTKSPKGDDIDCTANGGFPLCSPGPSS
ncbi:MAG: SBBP repeat-containing protein, partial [Bacteroidetes bacterium]|nr:SBBP repeat-containing protein [Bacteroidota bacterium]